MYMRDDNKNPLVIIAVNVTAINNLNRVVTASIKIVLQHPQCVWKHGMATCLTSGQETSSCSQTHLTLYE